MANHARKRKTTITATIERITNAFPADEQPQVRGMLAESLTAVVAQQLLKTADGTGRVAVHEILLGSPALAAMIREGKTFQVTNLMQAGGAVGMQTMDAALVSLVRTGKVSQKQAESRSQAPEELRRLLGAGALAA